MKVEVQIYGPLEKPNYGWITIGVFECRKIDVDHLRKKSLKIINKSHYRPDVNVVRLIIIHGREKIKIMIPDIMQEV